jgi:hypothetical protein
MGYNNALFNGSTTRVSLCLMVQESTQNVLTGLKCRYSDCHFLCTKLGEMKHHASEHHGGKEGGVSCTIKKTVDEKGVACLEEINGKFIVIYMNLQSPNVLLASTALEEVDPIEKDCATSVEDPGM